MAPRLSTFIKGTTKEDVPGETFDSESKVSTIVKEEALPVPSLKVKRVDYYYSRWGKAWKYRNMSSRVTVETLPILHTGSNDPWKDFSFVIVRTIPRQENQEPTFKIVVKSEYILKACKDVIQEWPGVSWTFNPLELNPEIFLTFFHEFVSYRDTLAAQKSKSEQDTHVLASVNLLLSSLSTDYRTTIATINQLTSHSEITFEYLYAILVPRTIFVTRCAMTGLPRLFKLASFQRTAFDGEPVYQLTCESVDLVDKVSGQGVGRVKTTILLKYFKGTTQIQDLNAYPMKYHSEEQELRESLIKRGKKWVQLIGVHHKQYSGVAVFRCGDKFTKHSVKGRIMIDRATFRRLNPNYQFPASVRPKAKELDHSPPHVPGPVIPVQPSVDTLQIPEQYANNVLVQSQSTDRDVVNSDLTDEDLLLTSTVVFGFSLSDKTWLEFNVERVEDVDWNVDAFANLVLPASRKNLLQSLVDAHHQELGFDDFIKGKGHGLVINLFGPPGVGKTFSAEATSEHVKRPLYVIGGGDLGTNASTLDAVLEKIFDIATAWKAIVLIDEADVFLEQRSLHDLERNAMVAVFLRHVEYYRGILFLTTNRVQAFDDAFLSRIHVALHFHELSQSSKEQVWTAFINKLGAKEQVTPEQIKELAGRDVNGRQIKNAVRTAHSLAVSRGEQIGFRHFTETLDAMEEFTKEFQDLKVAK